MQKKQQATKQTEKAIKVAPQIPTTLDMSSMEIEMTYGEVVAAYSALGFMGSRLGVDSFVFNIKLRSMRRALQPAVDDLEDMTQKLMLRLAAKGVDGEPLRDEKGGMSIKQPEFDIERREYLKQTVKIWTPVWRPCELEWMQGIHPEGVPVGFVFEVLESLGGLFTEDDECGPQDD